MSGLLGLLSLWPHSSQYGTSLRFWIESLRHSAVRYGDGPRLRAHSVALRGPQTLQRSPCVVSTPQVRQGRWVRFTSWGTQGGSGRER